MSTVVHAGGGIDGQNSPSGEHAPPPPSSGRQHVPLQSPSLAHIEAHAGGVSARQSWLLAHGGLQLFEHNELAGAQAC
jgi:hypothetical protein